jgi:hypothetical protein
MALRGGQLITVTQRRVDRVPRVGMVRRDGYGKARRSREYWVRFEDGEGRGYGIEI